MHEFPKLVGTSSVSISHAWETKTMLTTVHTVIAYMATGKRSA